jgi:zinc transporter ZupT
LTTHYLTLIIAVCLGLVHVFAGRIRFVNAIPSCRWISFSGGIAVAYVFIHLLPELSEFQTLIQPAANGVLGFMEHHAYLLALMGLAFFYGLERSTKISRKRTHEKTGGDSASRQMFWISIGSFVFYNAAIGYLLVSQGAHGHRNLVLFALAIALHFFVNDKALHEHHKHLYRRYGRWLLCIAVVSGAAMGVTMQVEDKFLAVVVSFLSGGIVLNVLKEELPDEQNSNFYAFALGAASYAGLLLAA